MHQPPHSELLEGKGDFFPLPAGCGICKNYWKYATLFAALHKLAWTIISQEAQIINMAWSLNSDITLVEYAQALY